MKPSELVAVLAERGELDAGSRVRDAFLRVPRERFVPEVYWVEAEGGVYVPRYRSANPAAWLAPLYENEPIVTQVDGGRAPLPGVVGRKPTSSISAPGIVALMLRQAGIEAGDRVLEIGTGSGYHTALCAYLADREVISVEFDGRLAQAAQARLSGYPARVVAGDGKAGWPQGAPYDVIISTVAFGQVPAAWLEQVAPGGRIVLPLHHPFYRWGVVTLIADGRGWAMGRFLHDGNFMLDRSAPVGANRPPFHDTGRDSSTSLHLADLLDDGDAQFAIAHVLPDLRQWKGLYESPDRAGWFTLWLWDDAGSWAAADYRTGATVFDVEQFGPRSLWDELECAFADWVELGRPKVEQWRYVVTPERQGLGLDGVEQAASSAAV